MQLLLLAAALLAADVRAIVPAQGPKPVGPYSPGLLAGDYLYVSGQGVNGPQGRPDGIDAQTRQCLDNVKSIVEAAGLTMDQVIYAQLYLSDIVTYEAVNRLWPGYFKTLPARATIAVKRMPTDTPVEVTVVAYKGARKAVVLRGAPAPVPIVPGVLTSDRFYFAGILGRDADTRRIPAKLDDQVTMLFDRLTRVLKAAKLSPRHVAFTNVYHTAAIPTATVEAAWKKYFGDDAPALALIEVPALPFNTNVSITGVAARDLKQRTRRANCIGIGDTNFCSSASEVGTPPANTLATNVYIDSIDNFATMNSAYAKAFSGKLLPTRTTVQPMPTEKSVPLRFSYVALQ